MIKIDEQLRRWLNYKEVAEHIGLVNSSQSEGEESEAGIEEFTEFDIVLPITLQIQNRVTPLREDHKKRTQWPDRERCVTPPLTSEMPWTFWMSICWEY